MYKSRSASSLERSLIPIELFEVLEGVLTEAISAGLLALLAVFWAKIQNPRALFAPNKKKPRHRVTTRVLR